jgi:hypothetical protein
VFFVPANERLFPYLCLDLLGLRFMLKMNGCLGFYARFIM